MENVIVWIFWAVIIIGSIASSAAKAKRKREEAERRAAQARTAMGLGPTAAGGPESDVDSKSAVHKSLADVLKELAEQATTQPSPTISSRPIASSRPVVLAQPVEPKQLGSTPAATCFDCYSLEDNYTDKDDEYVFGQDGSGGRKADAPKTKKSDTKEVVEAEAEDDTRITLAEILGEEFDLRRAVIEAEILTPKYAQRYK